MSEIIFDAKVFLKTLTTKPGIYRMLDENGSVIYVGKAKNLKKRVASYFTSSSKQQSPKNQAMIRHINNIEVTVTHTENEALILENNLIKELRPRYNIWFRDDKSYPYLYLSSDHEFPRLSYHRGARRGKGRYLGPYPSAGAVRKTLNLVQKLFRIRSCDQSFFANRTRPCLQYQIKRCTAPCVGLIDEASYQQDVHHAMMFLEGKNEEVINSLIEPMQKASENLDYERAAHYRDQISNLRKVQEHQYISAKEGDIDVIACSKAGGITCVLIFMIRSGLNIGSKTFFPKHSQNVECSDVIDAFLPQYYLGGQINKTIPNEIILSHDLEDINLIAGVLAEQRGKKVVLKYNPRGDRAKWIKMAINNAEIALQQRLSNLENQRYRMEALQTALKCEDPIERIECFDISHTQGEATVASCVVFDVNGPVSSDYRKFNITDITKGDDYAAMKQVITRRYTRVQKEEGKLPDLILIDGGKGQVSIAREVTEELQLPGILMIGIAKGPSRKPGMESLILAGENKTLQLAANSPALHLIQQIRDEAHRFAIIGHRQRRKKNSNQSPLETIAGVGNKRRQNLIKHFGGIQGVVRAGVDDLAMVSGINKNLAQKIYDTFHDNA